VKKGDIPVPYIVAIIIAIIVIVAIVYWFVYLRNQGDINVREQLCKGKELQYCTVWATCGIDDATCRPKTLDGKQGFLDHYPECKDFTWASVVGQDNNECKTVLGLKTSV